MQALLDVILPVFFVIGFGYLAVWRGWFSPSAVDGLMVFTQKFAIPCLLFVAISKLDLGQSFDMRLLGSFYVGALSGFILGFIGTRYIFGRSLEDATAVGFCCLFSNSVLLGLPITEQAYGAGALEANYAITAIHSPFCYGIGISVMEIIKARGASRGQIFAKVIKAMFSNSLILGIAAGFVVNLGDIALPGPISSSLDMMVRAALPAALFALGGVLFRYRPEGDLRLILYVCLVGLFIHPLITFSLGNAAGLSNASLRSAVITGAMAPGVNAYIFANMYGHARRVAASSVLIATLLTILTAWMWLGILP